jgi:8-oxo-dGTP diphosphatase
MADNIHDSERLAEGQQVITACAFIHQNVDGVDQVFLTKRAATKKFLPNVYELPGGHIDFGEDIVVGLEREIKEELNMRVTMGDPYDVFTYANHIKKSHSIQVTYFAKFTDLLEKIILQTKEVSEYRWFTEEEITNKVLCETKGVDDSEIKAIYKGFSLLKNKQINFG